MALHPLGPAFARVNRAEEHLTDFTQCVHTRLKAQRDAIILKMDPDKPDNIFVDRGNIPFAYEFSILLSEICFNLRAALDYLVYQLAILDSGSVKEKTQFPIEDCKKDFESRKKGWLKGLNSAHVAEIEALQPYNGCKWTAVLRDISNPDKHRSLIATQADHKLDVLAVDREHLSDLEDQPGEIISEIRPDGIEVYVKIHLTAEIQFADGKPIIEPLNVIKRRVADTLDAFKLEF
jgi:hypothetical protein